MQHNTRVRHPFDTVRMTHYTGSNAGMNLPMALLGHVTPEMTPRYARLASPTIRHAYETIMTKVNGRRSLFTTREWLAALGSALSAAALAEGGLSGTLCNRRDSRVRD
jgi:hypothetical protein